jgi:hypothetical protein
MFGFEVIDFPRKLVCIGVLACQVVPPQCAGLCDFTQGHPERTDPQAEILRLRRGFLGAAAGHLRPIIFGASTDTNPTMTESKAHDAVAQIDAAA